MAPGRNRDADESAVRRHLADGGLIPPRRGRSIEKAEITGERAPGVRLNSALEKLGPLFTSFGRYLATRPDLLPLHDCLALAGNGATVPPLPVDRVKNLLQREMPRAPDALVSTLEERPFRTRLIHQWHLSTLDGEERVVVKIVRPDFEERAESEDRLLDLLGGIDTGTPDWGEREIVSALKDFRRFIEGQLDLLEGLKGLAEIGEAKEWRDSLEGAKAYGELSSARAAVTGWIPRAAGEELSPGEQARQLAFAWLQQALLGDSFPEAPMAENMVMTGEGRVAVTGGTFARLERESRWSILDYLAAAASDDADRACEKLVLETVRPESSPPLEELKSKFRQAEPFRSGGWSNHLTGRRLGDTLFVQWRLARQSGYCPTPGLLSFYRGLFEIEKTCRDLDPSRDGLKQGLDDTRVVAAAVRMRELLGPARLRKNLERSAPAMMDLMQRLDREVSGEGRERREKSVGENRKTSLKERNKDRWTLFAGLFLLYVSISLIMGLLLPRLQKGSAAGGLAVALWTALAAVLFWQAGRIERE